MDKKDADRVAELFDAHAAKVHKYLQRRAGSSVAVEDLVSETFLVAARKVNSIPVDNELPWLYVTARNLLSNWLRLQVPEPVENVFLYQGNAENTDFDIGERLCLQEAWQRLSETDREVLLLAAWEGLSGKELAAVLEISEGGAVSALSRARARLSASLLN